MLRQCYFFDILHIEKYKIFVAIGMTKISSQTFIRFFLFQSIDELEQGAKLFSVFAQAYTDITLKRIENFSKVRHTHTYIYNSLFSYLVQLTQTYVHLLSKQNNFMVNNSFTEW